MIITMLRAADLGGSPLAVGTVVDLPATLANPIVALGQAVPTPAATPTVTFAPGVSGVTSFAALTDADDVDIPALNGPTAEAFDAKQDVTTALAAIAGLTPAADRIAFYNGANSASLTPLTAAARALLDDADASAMRNTLGLSSTGAQVRAFGLVSAPAVVPISTARGISGRVRIEGGAVGPNGTVIWVEQWKKTGTTDSPSFQVSTVAANAAISSSDHVSIGVTIATTNERAQAFGFLSGNRTDQSSLIYIHPLNVPDPTGSSIPSTGHGTKTVNTAADWDIVFSATTSTTDTAQLVNAVAIVINPDGVGGGGGATTLDGLTDVVASSPQLGDLVYYDGSGWVKLRNQYVSVTPNVDGTTAIPLDHALGPNKIIGAPAGAAQEFAVPTNMPDGSLMTLLITGGGYAGAFLPLWDSGSPSTPGWLLPVGSPTAASTSSYARRVVIERRGAKYTVIAVGAVEETL